MSSPPRLIAYNGESMLDLINPVIAAVRTDEEYLLATKSPVTAIFMLKADILTLPDLLACKRDKSVYIHIDIAEGIGKDKRALEYLKKCGADGIISTKNHMISAAKELGLGTVQRFFIIDSVSVATALDIVASTKPDYAELMPGILPKTVKSFVDKTHTKIIAGGLIETKKDVLAALSAGADGVSTGRKELWDV